MNSGRVGGDLAWLRCTISTACCTTRQHAVDMVHSMLSITFFKALGVFMRVVSIEEHFTIPELAARISSTRILDRGNPPPDRAPKLLGAIRAQLADLGDGRIADMDAADITLQVLSWAGPGADLLDDDEAVGWTRECNDALAETIAGQRPAAPVSPTCQ